MLKLIDKEINANLGVQTILIWTYVDLDLLFSKPSLQDKGNYNVPVYSVFYLLLETG